MILSSYPYSFDAFQSNVAVVDEKVFSIIDGDQFCLNTADLARVYILNISGLNEPLGPRTNGRGSVQPGAHRHIYTGRRGIQSDQIYPTRS